MDKTFAVSPPVTPWLSIIGIGEDGVEGLSYSSRHALFQADIVMGPKRHLAIMNGFFDKPSETFTQEDHTPKAPQKQIVWPVPFSDGIELLLSLQGQKVAVLASGDPFWFGVGSVIARKICPTQWQAFPSTSTFSLAASRLGWAIEHISCLGLHAAPFNQLRPLLHNKLKAIILIRDEHSVSQLASYLHELGLGASTLWIMKALGGPREEIHKTTVQSLLHTTINPQIKHMPTPVCVALEAKGPCPALSLASGLDDCWFETDGTMTKRPVRALALSALAPCIGEYLWDIGGGSGSISIEWLLRHPSQKASIIETIPDRISLIKANAERFGLEQRLDIIKAQAPDGLAALFLPDAVFIGGGLSTELLEWLFANLRSGTRIVAHSVTLESEALLSEWHAKAGGELMRLELSQSTPLGKKRAWKGQYPITQWSSSI